MIATSPTENERITLAFRQEYYNKAMGRWIYKNPEKPHFGSDRSPRPGAFGAKIFAPFEGVITQKIFGEQKTGYGHQVILQFQLPFRAETENMYGHKVILPANKNMFARFAHCQDMLVKAGDHVNVGDVIATIGNTGFAQGAHLHWEIISEGVRVNPEIVLEQAKAYKPQSTHKEVWRVKIYGENPDSTLEPVVRVSPKDLIVHVDFKEPV